MKPFLTIIMPLYQPERILKYTFDVLQAQTNQNFQLIVINDCSPNTKDEYQSFLKQYSFNITYLKTPINSKSGVARQMGLDIADTDWVLFLDDDDYLCSNNIIEQIYEIITTYTEIGFYFLRPQINNTPDNIDHIITNEKDLLGSYILNLSFIKQNQITFPTYWIGDDVFFIFKFLELAKLQQKPIRSINQYLSYLVRYTDSTTSLMKNENLLIKAIFDIQREIDTLFFLDSINQLNDDHLLDLKTLLQYQATYIRLLSYLTPNIYINTVINSLQNLSLLKEKYEISSLILNDDWLKYYNDLLEIFYQANQFNIFDHITIIMPCYQPDYIVERALNSFAIQTSHNFDIIIINDCSPNTKDEYKTLLSKYVNKLNITYYKTPNNCGPGETRQYALDHIVGGWILFVDDDDALANNTAIARFQRLIRTHDNNLWGIHGDREHYFNNVFYERLPGTELYSLTGFALNYNKLKKYNVRFNPILSYNYEDGMFMTEYCFYRNQENGYDLSIPQVYNCYHDEEHDSITKYQTLIQTVLFEAIYWAEYIKFSIPHGLDFFLILARQKKYCYIFYQYYKLSNTQLKSWQKTNLIAAIKYLMSVAEKYKDNLIFSETELLYPMYENMRLEYELEFSQDDYKLFKQIMEEYL